MKPLYFFLGILVSIPLIHAMEEQQITKADPHLTKGVTLISEKSLKTKEFSVITQRLYIPVLLEYSEEALYRTGIKKIDTYLQHMYKEPCEYSGERHETSYLGHHLESLCHTIGGTQEELKAQFEKIDNLYKDAFAKIENRIKK